MKLSEILSAFGSGVVKVLDEKLNEFYNKQIPRKEDGEIDLKAIENIGESFTEDAMKVISPILGKLKVTYKKSEEIVKLEEPKDKEETF